MILGWSPHASGPARAVIGYLLDPVIRATVVGRREDLVRDPPPELLVGDPRLVGAAIDALRTVNRYACATLSFAPDDIDPDAWGRGDPDLHGQIFATVDLFMEVAFAGIPKRARPPVLTGTHLHTGRLEINILLPRAILRSTSTARLRTRSWSPNPPRSESREIWGAFTDTVNGTHGWADPGDPVRAAKVRAPSWLMKRAAATERWLASSRDEGDPDVTRADRLAAEDPRVKILMAARSSERDGVSTREAMLEDLDPVLTGLGWRVGGLEHRHTILEPVEGRPGEGLVLTGTLFAATARPDPVAEEAARLVRVQFLEEAPARLVRAMARRAIYNRKVLGLGAWPATPLPDPLDILMAPAFPRPPPIARLARQVARLVSRLVWNLQPAVLADRLAVALQSRRGLDFASVTETLVHLETHHARRQHRRPEQICPGPREVDLDPVPDSASPDL